MEQPPEWNPSEGFVGGGVSKSGTSASSGWGWAAPVL